jgi:hypothetical protein
MRGKRVIQRRSPGGISPTCGCLGILFGTGVVMVIALILLLPALPGLALQFAGFSRSGSTASLFQNVPPSAASIPGAIQPVGLSVSAGSYGRFDLPAGAGYQVTVGAGQAAVSITEAGLLDQCRLRSALCGAGDGQFRNARFDFKPGGAVIYVDAFISTFNLWQTVGLVLRVDPSGRQFTVAGVDVGGALYSVPESGLGAEIDRIANAANDALNQLTVNITESTYVLQSIRLDESSLTLLLGRL